MSTRDKLKPYQADALFLIVGTNPLPDYVSADLLLKEGGSLYLIHSSGPQGTGKVAQRLAVKFPQYHPQLIPVDPLDTTGLRREVEQYLAQTRPGSISLNYTGGNKVMAVHTYQAVDEFCKGHRGDPIFSYLDAETLEMIIEPSVGRPMIRQKVVQDVAISIRDLLDLHGIRLPGQLQTEPIMPDLARTLAGLHGSTRGIAAWKACRQILGNSDGRLWGEVKVDLNAELSSADAPSGIVDRLAEALGFAEDRPISLSAAAIHAGLKSVRELRLWLDGKWLENWVLACVKELSYQERACGLVGFAPRQFEIDAAVMVGYQLFALSCGVTQVPGDAKLKLLEIFTRARQIGGDEARVAAVCPVADPEGLQQEIAFDWDTGKRVRVFGSKHLPVLSTHLKSWLETA